MLGWGGSRWSRLGAVFVATAVFCTALIGSTGTPAQAAPAQPGDEIWARVNPSLTAARTYSSAAAVATNPDGSLVFVAGSSLLPAGPGAVVIAYREDGSRQWTARVGVHDGYSAAAGAIAVSPDGTRVFVVGSESREQNSASLLVFALDAATGGPVWRRTFHARHDTHDFGGSIAVSPDGSRVYAAGESDPVNHYRTTLLVAFDAASGARQWVTRGADLDAEDLAMTPDGSTLFTTGEAAGGYTVTEAFDSATGERRWGATAAVAEGYVIGSRLVTSSDGARLFMTGVEWTVSGTSDFVTIAYDVATGDEIWSTVYDSPRHRQDAPTDLAIAPDDGTLYATGVTGRLALTVAFDATTGTRRWASTYKSPNGGREFPTAIAADGNGVFVTGNGPGTAGTDVVTLAYEPSTGGQLWVSRHAAAMGSSASAIALDTAHARLYVAGTDSSFSASRFLTIRYAT